jgi:glycogen debranching enzyme
LTAAVQSAAASVHHVLARSVASDDRTRVLKHADAFAVFDHHGDIVPGGLGVHGLYSEGTRFLSTWLLDVEGVRPFFLGATVRNEGDQLATNFTNPDLDEGGNLRMPLGTLRVCVQKFLWRDVLYQRVSVTSFASHVVEAELTLHFAADFADIFEVRGMKRGARGADLPPVIARSAVTLGYRGLDALERRTELAFVPAPRVLDAASARFRLRLEPRSEQRLEVAVTCTRSTVAIPDPDPERFRPSRRSGSPAGRSAHPVAFDDARTQAMADLERYRSRSCRIRTSNERVNMWIDRAIDDLHMLTTELDTGPYPYAGIPWFNTPFGRDGLVTALECSWARPELARGVLRYLASTQARGIVPEEEAEPGRILHETRSGEMARTGEMPFGRYYGSVDATPLFVMLAGEYHRRTADLELVHSLWPSIRACLEWIERYGDRDGDGFLEYEGRIRSGLVHQGWKDSDEAIMHADGSPAEGPIALCEVQGYLFAAWRSGAALAAALGLHDMARDLEQRARHLFARFDTAFWCGDLSTYALALDGDKRPCRVRSSNAGQCLFTRIARPERARSVARALLAPDSFSGWGVRTLAASEIRFNPMGYHTGTVWPHDNALVAWGLGGYGHRSEALEIFSGLLGAALSFELCRMPELFCGFDRVPGEGPVAHPIACAPQAWAAGSVLLLLRTSLGLEVNALDGCGRVVLTRPRLPVEIREVRIHDLEVAGGSLDIAVSQDGDHVAVNVLRREGQAEVVVVE